MANDLVTRLLLNSSNFDNNIRKSTKEMQMMQRQAQTIKNGLSSAFLGVGAAIGVATTAQEAFKKVIASSQTLTDEYGSKLEQAKTTVNEFFYSMGSGDWSLFHDGFDKTIKKAEDLYKALDQLNNTRISYSYFSEKHDDTIENARLVATDKSKSKEERETALTTWQSAIDAKKTDSETLKSDIIETLGKFVGKGTNIDAESITMADFEKALSIDLMNPEQRSTYKNKIKLDYGQYLNKMQKTEADLFDSFFPTEKGDIRIENDLSNRAKLNEEYRDIIIAWQMLEKWDDETLQNVVGMGKEYNMINKSIAGNQRTFNQTQNKITGDKTTQNKIDVPIEYYVNENQLLSTIEVLKAKIDTGLSSVEIVPIKAEQIEDAVEESELTDIELKLRVKLQNYETAKQKISELQKLMEIATDASDIAQIQTQIESWKSFGGIVDEKKINSQTDAINEYASAFSGLGSAFSNLGQISDNDALGWMGNSIGQISQMVTSLMGLTMAKGVASVFDLPFPASLAAMGTVLATITSVFAGIPKFASGGIFSGNSTVGDMNLARVNAGEMILNNRQQRNLFNMLNGSGASPYSTGGGNVSFEIKGDKLVGVLNNYNRKKSKI